MPETYQYRVVCADGYETTARFTTTEATRRAVAEWDLLGCCDPHRVQRSLDGIAWEDVPDG